MNYIGLSKYDTANGPGVRVSLFVSGCTVHCRGCFNEESWDFKAGKPFTDETTEEILKALDSKWVSGFSLLGGDPFEPEHEETLVKLLTTIRGRFPEKSVWAWTGRMFEKIASSPLLPLIDMLVDGPFIEKHKMTKQGAWRGSDNQRIIPLVCGKVDYSDAGRAAAERAQVEH